ncbi:TPA: LPXTG cell wall anchor domain-containing protein [Streptococcus suis]
MSESTSTSTSEWPNSPRRNKSSLPNTGERTASVGAYVASLLFGAAALSSKRRRRDDKQD